MLINLSNHPSSEWGTEQLATAKDKYGEILDIAFPSLAPEGDEKYILKIVNGYFQKIIGMIETPTLSAVHIMGESTFVHQLVNKFREAGIICIASTTQRMVKLKRNGKKVSNFNFVRFRNY